MGVEYLKNTLRITALERARDLLSASSEGAVDLGCFEVLENMIEEIQLASEKEQAETVDERAEFEKAWRKVRHYDSNIDFHLRRNSLHLDKYVEHDVIAGWELWQARAQLTTAKPSTDSEDTKRLDWFNKNQPTVHHVLGLNSFKFGIDVSTDEQESIFENADIRTAIDAAINSEKANNET